MSTDPSNMYFPTLETDRLKLRALAVEDTAFLFELLTDPKVSQFTMDIPPTDHDQARDLITYYLGPAGASENRWGIYHKDDGRYIGTCGFHRWSKQHMRAEIGCDLSPEYWGRGYMTEALRAAIRNGFERMNLNRIEAMVYVKNDGSIRLLERLGFYKEGTLRQYYSLRGEFFDQHLFSLLRSDAGESLDRTHS